MPEARIKKILFNLEIMTRLFVNRIRVEHINVPQINQFLYPSKQWKRLNLANRRDCITFQSICQQSARAMSVHLKLNNKLTSGTAFDKIEKSKCRLVMLKFTNDGQTSHENDIIRENRHEHLRKCASCFSIFTKQLFYNTTDRVYGIIILHDINDASCNGKWAKNNGMDYFYTDDLIGVGISDSNSVGPCVQALTGFNRHQGRIAAVAYAVQHCTMEVSQSKSYLNKALIDIRKVHKGKLEFFANALIEYFKNSVWTDEDTSNNYLRLVGELAYKCYDVTTNVAKV